MTAAFPIIQLKNGKHITTDGTKFDRHVDANAHQRRLRREARIQAVITAYFPKSTGKRVSLQKLGHMMTENQTFKRAFLKASRY